MNKFLASYANSGLIVAGSLDCCLYNSFCLVKNKPNAGLLGSSINLEILCKLVDTVAK